MLNQLFNRSELVRAFDSPDVAVVAVAALVVKPHHPHTINRIGGPVLGLLLIAISDR